MAEYLNQRQFAELCGITQQGVSYAVGDGRIEKTHKGIDPGHPTNKYFREQILARKGVTPINAPGKLPPAGPKVRQRSVSNSDMSTSGAGLTRKQLDIEGLDSDGEGKIYGHQIDAAKKLAQAKSYQIKNARERGALIDRELVKQFLGKLYSIESSELGTLGEKLGPAIAGLLGIDDAGLVLEVGKTINLEISKTIDHIELEMGRYLKGLAVEDGA